MSVPDPDGRTHDQTSGRLLALFVSTVLVTVVGLGISKFASEPYPALFNPGFAGSQEQDGRTTITEPSAELELADGTSVPIDYDDLFPPNPMRSSTLLSNAYGTEDKAADAASRAWLRERLDREYPALDVVAVDLTWTKVTYVIATQEIVDEVVDRTVRVDLGGTA